MSLHKFSPLALCLFMLITINSLAAKYGQLYIHKVFTMKIFGIEVMCTSGQRVYVIQYGVYDASRLLHMCPLQNENVDAQERMLQCSFFCDTYLLQAYGIHCAACLLSMIHMIARELVDRYQDVSSEIEHSTFRVVWNALLVQNRIFGWWSLHLNIEPLLYSPNFTNFSRAWCRHSNDHKASSHTNKEQSHKS